MYRAHAGSRQPAMLGDYIAKEVFWSSEMTPLLFEFIGREESVGVESGSLSRDRCSVRSKESLSQKIYFDLDPELRLSLQEHQRSRLHIWTSCGLPTTSVEHAHPFKCQDDRLMISRVIAHDFVQQLSFTYNEEARKRIQKLPYEASTKFSTASHPQ